MDQMIAVSDNHAACAVLQALYDVGQLDECNRHFADRAGQAGRRRPDGHAPASARG
jgi:hypothetical protein